MSEIANNPFLVWWLETERPSCNKTYTTHSGNVLVETDVFIGSKTAMRIRKLLETGDLLGQVNKRLMTYNCFKKKM